MQSVMLRQMNVSRASLILMVEIVSDVWLVNLSQINKNLNVPQLFGSYKVV